MRINFEKVFSEIQQEMEDNIYKILKDGKVGEKIAEYKTQTLEEIAEVMTEGLMQSWVGDVVRNLEKKFLKPPIDAKQAFKKAMIRLIKETRVT